MTVVSRPLALRAAGVIALAFALWLSLCFSALAAPTFPALEGRVVDEAHLLQPATRQALEEKLATLETQTSDQLVVVTLNSLQGYEIEDYGYQLGRAWGIGQKDNDNGVLLIIAPNERKVRIEVGYGLEPILTDALSAQIIQREILPSFRTGGFEQGISRGSDAIIEQLTMDRDEAAARAAAVQPPQRDKDIKPVLIVILVFFFLFVALMRSAAGGRRRRHGGASGALPAILIWMAEEARRNRNDRDGGGGFGRFGGGGFGGGGFGGGGGSFGGGGASGGW